MEMPKDPTKILLDLQTPAQKAYKNIGYKRRGKNPIKS